MRTEAQSKLMIRALLFVRRLICIVGAALLGVAPLRADTDRAVPVSFLDSTVKLYATLQRDDYATPWQSGRPIQVTGSGFVIRNRRILTNAHIVSDARFLQVQKRDDPKLHTARVVFSGNDCDLALLEVEDESFFDGMDPVVFADSLPELSDEVAVVGYPLGGTRLSITRGVVSRIDYSTYSHSGVDQHLVLQVDAAINPGNSGGPVVYRDRVVGLAFQGLMMAENIGYAIPVPVINHFLADVEDGIHNGYQELGVAYMNTMNPALRADLEIPGDGGVAVTYVDPFACGLGRIFPRDVLLSIDGLPIANDGTITLDGETVVFLEIVERKQWGDTAVFEVWRNGGVETVPVTFRTQFDPFTFRNIYDRRPEYVVFAGLVFSPLTRNYLNALRGDMQDERRHQLYYYSAFAKVDGLHEGRDEFVVLIRRLPHAINTYANRFANCIVEEVNGVRIRRLSDVAEALKKPERGFHVMRFANVEDFLVVDAADAEAVQDDILRSYGIHEAMFIHEN